MKNLLTIVLSCFCATAYSQDPNFSQFQSSPLTLNPASAGLGEGEGRISGNFRNTWIGNVSPFVTGLISYDVALMRNRISTNDRLGFGLLAMYDQSNGGALKASTVALTAAYNKGLNASGTSNIGFGFQAVYVAKRLDYNRLTFEDQFGSGGFNLSLPSSDAVSAEGARSYLDFNVGLLYRVRLGRIDGYVGAMAAHLARSSENFYDVETNTGARLSFNAGGTYHLESSDEIVAHLQYRERIKATEETIFIAYGKKVESAEGNDVAIYFGGGTRLKDSWFPYVGLQYNGVKAGLTYDVSWPTIKTGSISRKSMELSANYIIGYKKK